MSPSLHACVLICVRLFETQWTVTCQATLSTGLSQQEYWSGLPFTPPGDLPALEGGFFTPSPLGSPSLRTASTYSFDSKGRTFWSQQIPLGRNLYSHPYWLQDHRLIPYFVCLGFLRGKLRCSYLIVLSFLGI